MRALALEPILPWPKDSRRVVGRTPPPLPSEAGWSSHTVRRLEEPLAKVAALLISISQNNTYEGRDPAQVPDALSSGFVADLLGVDVETLASLLIDLRHRGLIEPGDDHTLRLKDLDGLQQLVN